MVSYETKEGRVIVFRIKDIHLQEIKIGKDIWS